MEHELGKGQEMTRGRWENHRTLMLVCLSVAYFFATNWGMAADQKPAIGGKVATFSLKDAYGKEWMLDSIPADRFVVVAFLGTECPLVQAYAPRLPELLAPYGDRVTLVAINSNRHDSISEIQAFVQRFKLNYPMLKDVGNVVADRFGADRTPQVFVLDQERKVRYAGRIDDQFSVGGKSRPSATVHDLKNALDDLVAGKPVRVPLTEAEGCLIGRIRENAIVPSDVTFSKQISRIMQEHCQECHRPGEIAPFSLIDFEEVAGWADMIVEVTSNRQMPPWHATPGQHQFANQRRISDDDLKTLKAWVRAGTPAGNPADLPPPRTFSTKWHLPRDPDAIVAMRKEPFQVPATGVVRYQHFIVDPEFKEDKWVTAAEVIPGNRAIVHHTIVFSASALKSGEGDRNFLVAYVPGLKTEPFPQGMAKKIPAGSKLIFQMHYTPNGEKLEDLTKVGFCFASPETITHEVRTTSVRVANLKIEPFQDNQKFESRPVTTPANVLLLGMAPHMHLRGKSFRYELTTADGKTETLLDVPQYDFNWQTSYRLKEPLKLAAGSSMKGFASYDNSERNLANPDPSATVTWGDQSWDEMMLGYFDIAITREDADSARGWNLPRAEIAERIIKMLDRNNDKKLTRDEVPRERHTLFDKLDKNKDDVLTSEELEAGADILKKALGR